MNLFFGITDENETEVFEDVGKNRKKTENRIQFEEKCYLTKLTFDEVRKYLDILSKRHADIEEVINEHYNTVKKAIVKDKQDKMYRQMRKDEEEQKKMSGKSKGDKTSRTARKSTARSGVSKEETKKEKDEREEEDRIQK